MQGILKLKNPVMIDGKQVTEMTYDSNEINGALFVTAESKKKIAEGIKNVTIAAAAEFDFGLHLYLGFASIIAVNPSYDFSDVERIKGWDIKDVMAIGRNFMLKSEAASTANASDEPTEISQESIIQADLNSNESE